MIWSGHHGWTAPPRGASAKPAPPQQPVGSEECEPSLGWGYHSSHVTKTGHYLIPRAQGSERLMLCSKRGNINGPVRKTHSSVLVANSPEKHQRTPFANFRTRSHLAVRKTHHFRIMPIAEHVRDSRDITSGTCDVHKKSLPDPDIFICA